MLVHLTIKNYALIETLEIEFDGGFNTITGETGAGKSILLGALSLVLGKRADTSSLRDIDKKCIVEAEFSIKDYGLQSFFNSNELDYDDVTLLRREISPSGKSRAFINDSPVTLTVLSALGERLVDVHSQHQTLRLTENEFQFKVLDAYANNQGRLLRYQQQLTSYKKSKNLLDNLIEKQETAAKESDYNNFLFQELEDAKLKQGMQEELETEYEQLSNFENILETLSVANQLVNGEEIGISAQLMQLKQTLGKISSLGNSFRSLLERVESVAIELDDIGTELEHISEGIEPNPERLEQVNLQIGQLHDLMKKHQTNSIDELISIKEDLEKKVEFSLNIESKIAAQKEQVEQDKNELEKLALEIRRNRLKIIPQLKKKIESSLSNLGMPSASFKIEIIASDDFKNNGKDLLEFQFSANKGSDFGKLKKVASGGELSRIMLVIKSILAEYDKLPTLMFDEIDTGVSGDISTKMGGIMKKMGRSMQVFSITHLPQIAAQGEKQYKVFKKEGKETTTTLIKSLNDEERVAELAEMLGGKEITDSAINHAKELLSFN